MTFVALTPKCHPKNVTKAMYTGDCNAAMKPHDLEALKQRWPYAWHYMIDTSSWQPGGDHWMYQIYDYWLIYLARGLKIQGFRKMTTAHKIRCLEQHPPLLLFMYKDLPKPILYRSLQARGIGRLSRLKKCELADLAARLMVEIRHQ